MTGPKWAYRMMKGGRGDKPPSPWWVSVLWLLALMLGCGFIVWRMTVGGF